MKASVNQPVRKFLAVLAHPRMFFYVLPWLMVLLTLGTVAQRYIGLYESQKLFFGSFVLWLGPIPAPGAYTILAFMTLSLLARLFCHPPTRATLGTFIVHVAALLLLIGGLVTAFASEEGYIVLGAGETTTHLTDYRLHELTIRKNGELLFAIPESELATPLTSPLLPFTLRVLAHCNHCEAVPQTSRAANLQGVAREVTIKPASLPVEAAQTQAGARFELKGVAEGEYVTFEGLNTQPEIQLGDDRYTITMRPLERALPFSLSLFSFEKRDYPGTSLARDYRSDVSITDNGFTWHTVISMNEPLRYHGYTLYQSSYVEEKDGLHTVLAVVKNIGAPFPYLSIAALCVGLLLHLVLVRREQRT